MWVVSSATNSGCGRMQAEYETSDQLMSFLDTSGDAQVSPGQADTGQGSV